VRYVIIPLVSLSDILCAACLLARRGLNANGNRDMGRVGVACAPPGSTLATLVAILLFQVFGLSSIFYGFRGLGSSVSRVETGAARNPHMERP
jgi:hypothetical protein